MATLETGLRLRDEFTSVLKKISNSTQEATSAFEKMKDAVQKPAQGFAKLQQAAGQAMSQLNSKITQGFTAAMNAGKSNIERIRSLFSSFGNRVSNALHLDKVASTFQTLGGKVQSMFSRVGHWIQPFTQRMSQAFQSVRAKASEVAQSIATGFGNGLKNAGNHFNNFANNAKNALSRIKSALASAQSAVQSGWGKITGSANGGGGGGMFKSLLGAMGVYKAADMVSNGIRGITEELSGNAVAWKTFEGNMQSIGKTPQQIQSAQKSLSDFAQKTIYNASDMAVTYSQMATLGYKDTTKLVKGMGGLAASAENPAQAMKTLSTQMTQALAKPKLQWQDFKLMMEQSPAAMTQVAKKMGYSMSDFLSAISEGKIKSSEFADAIAEVGNSQVYTKMATEFKTVGQAMDGLRESLATKLMPVYDAVSQAGIRAVTTFGDALEQRIDFDKIGAQLKQMLDKIDFNDLIDRAFKAFDSIAKKATDLWKGFTDSGGVKAVLNTFKQVGEALKHVFASIDFNYIGKTIGMITQGISAMTTGISGFVRAIPQGVLDVFTKGLVTLGGVLVSYKIASRLKDIAVGMGQIASAPFKGLATLFGNRKKKGPSDLSDLSGKKFSLKRKKIKQPELPELSTQQLFAPLMETVNGFAKKAGNLALVWGTIKIVEELAQALSDVSKKVPSSLPDLLPKLANMALVLAGMSAFVNQVGKSVAKNPGQAVKGLAMVTGVVGELMLAASALEQINNQVPDNIASVAAKMANIAIAIGGMGVLVGVAGKFASSNPMSAIAGLGFVAGVSANLMLAAEAMQQVNNKVTDDIGSFASKVANIAIGIGAMGGLTAVAGLVAAAAPIVIPGLLAVAALAGELMLTAEAIQQINDKVPDDLSGVQAKIEGIKSAIQTIADTSFGEMLGNIAGVISFGAATRTFQSMQEMIPSIQALSQATFDPSTVKTKIQGIRDAIAAIGDSSLSDILGNLANNLNFGQARGVFESMQQMIPPLQALSQAEFDAGSIKAKIEAIRDVLTTIQTGGFWDVVKNLMGVAFQDMGAAATAVNGMVGIAHSLGQLAAVEVDFASVNEKVTQIQQVLQKLTGDTVFGTMGSAMNLGVYDMAVSAVSKLQQVATSLTQLTATPIDLGAVNATIDSVKQAIEKLNTLPTEVTANFAGMQGLVASFQSLMQTLASLTASTQIQVSGLASAFSQLGSSAANMSNQVSASMNSMRGAIASVMGQIPSLATSAMATFTSAVRSGMAQAASAARAGAAQIVSAFSQLSSQLSSAGRFAMAGFANGIRAGAGAAIAAARSVAQSVASIVSSALRIGSPSRVMMEIGGFVSEGLAIGINKQQPLVERASQALADSAAFSPQLAFDGGQWNPSALGFDYDDGFGIHVDNNDLERLRAGVRQNIVVKNQQTTPQVTVVVDNQYGQDLDENRIADLVEQKIIDAMASDMS
ncbi:MAG: tape measure protein [Aerococcus sp.]|nr:tape measure protein [Aerococcus sp.]